jgi:hypothetical protein
MTREKNPELPQGRSSQQRLGDGAGSGRWRVDAVETRFWIRGLERWSPRRDGRWAQRSGGRDEKNRNRDGAVGDRMVTANSSPFGSMARGRLRGRLVGVPAATHPLGAGTGLILKGGLNHSRRCREPREEGDENRRAEPSHSRSIFLHRGSFNFVALTRGIAHREGEESLSPLPRGEWDGLHSSTAPDAMSPRT